MLSSKILYTSNALFEIATLELILHTYTHIQKQYVFKAFG